MFSDGRQVFDLSELLEYKRGHTPDMPFKSIRDDDVRVSTSHPPPSRNDIPDLVMNSFHLSLKALLKMMLQLDPSQRAAASVCLTAREACTAKVELTCVM